MLIDNIIKEKNLRVLRRYPNRKVIIYHPTENRFIFLHRFLMEQEMGKPLQGEEVVFFKNKNMKDIRIENLGVVKKGQWVRQHKSKLNPIPPKFCLWLLYKVFRLSATTMATFYKVPAITIYTALWFRGIKTRDVSTSNKRRWRKWNEIARGFIGAKKEGIVMATPVLQKTA